MTQCHSFLHGVLAQKRPSILPHPYVNLKQPAPCPVVRPGISSSSPWNLRPAAVWDGIDRVALQVAWQERHSSKNILHRADVECWHLIGSPFVQHGNALPLHATVWGQADWLECAEEDQRDLLVSLRIIL